MTGRHLILYCDGSVRTGGRGGIGVVVADGDTGLPIRRFGEPLDTPQSSNTAAEQNRKRFRQHPRKRNSINTQKEVRTDMRLVVTQPELLEADVYPVRLDAVEPVQGNFGEQLRWRFTVTDGKHKGATLSAWSNLSSAMNSKTLRWASVLAGEQFAAGDVVNFDQLVGRQARAVVDVRTGADGRQHNRVTDLLPLRKQQADDDPFLEED